LRFLLLFLFLIFPLSALSQELEVVTDSASLREVPFGRILKTLNKNTEDNLRAIFGFWGKTDGGWINLDYCDYTFPLLKETGRINLSYVLFDSPESLDGVKVRRNDVIYIPEGGKYFVFKNRLYSVGDKRLNVERGEFSIVILNRDSVLSDGESSVKLKAGSVLLRGDSGYIYDYHYYTNLIPVEIKGNFKKVEVLKEINKIIDIFNSAKLSSSLSERLGYYVKTLPVRDSDLEVLRLRDGIGVKLKLRYEFFSKDGSPITWRKTRLFLKRGNYEFWRHLSQSLFRNGVNKFVDIEVLRFDGRGSFENCGFVVSSYHLFNLGYLDNWKSFLESSESNLSDDLWFFADEVYERLEGD